VIVVELSARLRALALRPGAPARFAAATAPLLDGMQPAREVRPTQPADWVRFEGRCPNYAAHTRHDRKPSFYVSIRHDGVLGVWCFRCQSSPQDVHRVLSPLGLTTSDLFPSRKMTFKPSTLQIKNAQANLRRDGGRLIMQMGLREGIAPSSLVALGVGKAGDRLRYPELRADGTLCAYTDVLPRWLRDERVLSHHSHGRRGLIFRDEARRAPVVHIAEGPGIAPALITLGREPVCLPHEKAHADDLPNIIQRSTLVYVMPDFSSSSRDYFIAVGRLLLRHDFERVMLLDVAPDRDDGDDFADVLREVGPDAAESVLRSSEAEARSIEPLPPGRPPREREIAATWLVDVLDEHGPMPWSDVKAMLPDQINERTLRRARQRVASLDDQTGCWDRPHDRERSSDEPC
jgi:hypothetical protein